MNIIKISLKKSLIGICKKYRIIAKKLFLNSINKNFEFIDTPEIRGMINKISHIINISFLLNDN